MGRFITSGHNIDDGITPVYSHNDPWPTFQKEDIVFYDQVHEVNHSGTQNRIRFNNSNGVLYIVTKMDGTFPFTDDELPKQWTDDGLMRSGAAACSIRWVADLGPVALWPETNSYFNVWYPMANSCTYRLGNGVPFTTNINRSVFQIARSNNLNVILAQATKTFIHTNTP